MSRRRHTSEFEDCLRKVMARGKDKASAYAICTAAFQKAGKPIWERTKILATNPIREKIVEKPLRIRGVAIKAGQSRNYNIYLSEELKKAAAKLVGAPVYIEHVYATNAIGKVTDASWDEKSKSIVYEAEIYDDEIQEKIRKGLIKHVSLAADYEKLEIVDGKIPIGLHNCELSLVAVPGIPDTNIQIVKEIAEKIKEQGEAQEFIYYEIRDPQGFMPEHFSIGWIDSVNGIKAVFARERENPESIQPVALLFMKSAGWTFETVQKWLKEHPQYVSQETVQSSPLEPSRMTGVMERVWTRRYIDDLPDSAFALILPGGTKDEEGKTVPRSLRKFPHHRKDGSVDIPHLRNANARVGIMLKNPELRGELTTAQLEAAKAHLDRHKKELGIGEFHKEEQKRIKDEVQREFEVPSWFLPYLESIEETINELDEKVGEIESKIKELEFKKEEQTSFQPISNEELESRVKLAEERLRKVEGKFSAFKKMVEAVIPDRKIWDKWGHGPKQMIYQLKRVLRSPAFRESEDMKNGGMRHG